MCVYICVYLPQSTKYYRLCVCVRLSLNLFVNLYSYLICIRICHSPWFRLRSCSRFNNIYGSTVCDRLSGLFTARSVGNFPRLRHALALAHSIMFCLIDWCSSCWSCTIPNVRNKVEKDSSSFPNVNVGNSPGLDRSIKWSSLSPLRNWLIWAWTSAPIICGSWCGMDSKTLLYFFVVLYYLFCHILK